MAEFRADVAKVSQVRPHPDAERLEVVQVLGFELVTGLGQYRRGDLLVHIPPAAVLPPGLISELGLTGRLEGPLSDRVRAVSLRGVLSYGIAYPVRGLIARGFPEESLVEGTDVKDFLGITKYEPPVPPGMEGTLRRAYGCTVGFDVDPLKKHPDVLRSSDRVEITEKLHGTWCCLGYHPDVGPVVSSKGPSGKGLTFRLDSPENASNLYVRQWERHAARLLPWLRARGGPFYLIGEVIGPGVQKGPWSYGLSQQQFWMFDAYEGPPGAGRWLDSAEVDEVSAATGMPRVPVLYRGTFRLAPMTGLLSEPSAMCRDQMREGVVVRTDPPRRSASLGGSRVILKCVSDRYLSRKGGSEYT